MGLGARLLAFANCSSLKTRMVPFIILKIHLEFLNNLGLEGPQIIWITNL
jgi:hypothetical protein